ncbi:cupin domain-containing protein [Deinococcus psychrotolerans]|uniref:Cupin domain-containing protein n=1 Tax=Deinococcus psychrotolerans TaxID=2489213 RepID=A0A3G8YG01_9DEIO|nr:cupin domain-containing protein [Deinococcus psychrotolerans]AZI44269.1 cupin domain-containing protein [Deinococcus psychrotolerans]
MPHQHTEHHPVPAFSRRELMQRAAVLGLVSLPLLRGAALAQSTPPAATPSVPLPATRTASDYKLSLAGLPAVAIPTDVSARKGNKAAWPLLTGVSIAQVEIPEGTWRAPHYHTNTSELAVIVQGSAKAGLQTPGQEWMELEMGAGDCVYFPLGWPHWLRNTGSSVLHTYFNYGHEQPATVEVPG